MMAELALGRRTRRNPVGAFQTLFPQSAWWFVGGLAVLASIGILSFCSVVAGWTIAYVGFTAAKTVGGSSQEIGAFFDSFTANGWLNLALTFSVLVMTVGLILGGVRSGIERWTKTLMPLLIGLLAIRALSLPGASEGLAYYFKPDVNKLFDIEVLHTAMGQAFFSLSLGMGYLKRISSLWCGSYGMITPSPLWGFSSVSSWVTFGKPTRLWKNCSRTTLGFRGHGFGVR